MEQYIARLRAINDAAAAKIEEYLDSYWADDFSLYDWNALIQYAYSIATVYGEAAAALACEFYDLISGKSGGFRRPAEPAEPPSMKDVAKGVRGTGKTGNPALITDSVTRLVKRTAVDTTIKNAMRDGAEIAWIPSGDSCAFCLMLASNGWQNASQKTVRSGILHDNHAKHIHANCDCTYAVRFDGKSSVAGYDPSKYQRIYEDAAGSTWQEKLNSMRAEQDAENRSEINAQKRAAYAARVEREAN